MIGKKWSTILTLTVRNFHPVTRSEAEPDKLSDRSNRYQDLSISEISMHGSVINAQSAATRGSPGSLPRFPRRTRGESAVADGAIHPRRRGRKEKT